MDSAARYNGRPPALHAQDIGSSVLEFIFMKKTSKERAEVRSEFSVAATATAAEPNLGTKSVENAIAILLAFADATHPLGVSEIARGIGMHKSTVSRQLATLSRVDFVKREEGSPRYTLGLGLLPLAAAALANHRLSARARLQLEMLARETGENVTFSGWNGHDAINLEEISGKQGNQRVAPPGRLNPAHCTATGKVFLASLSSVDLQRRLSEPLKQYTDHTITDPKILTESLSAARERGAAISDGEFRSDIWAVAAPIVSRDGLTRYSIAITIPSYRRETKPLESLLAPLLFAAGSIAEEL
jgi:DNA-binding IclR family transcriptional regulator